MTRPSTDRSPGRWKVQYGGVGSATWSENAMTFDDEAAAKAYASDLLSRWTGADIARAVPVETPTGGVIDPADPAITINDRIHA